MDRPLIFIVDDESKIRRLVAVNLESSGFDVMTADDGKRALEVLQHTDVKPDLIVLDVMMPGLDGLEVLKIIRSHSPIPVIIVSARNDVRTKIEGFRLGTDDYIVKPFLPKELVARTIALLRRCYREDGMIVQLEHAKVDFSRAEVIRGGERLPLTGKEHDILLMLYNNAGRVISLDRLCEAVWGDNRYGYENSLMAHIRHIREKIEKDPSRPVSLITVKGLGYKLKI